MSQKIRLLVAAILLSCAASVSTAPTTITGVLVDRACFAKAKLDTANASKSAHDICLAACSKLTGIRIALVTDKGDVYTVTGDFTDNSNAKLIPHLCHTVTLTGDVTGDVKNVQLRILVTDLKMVSK